MIYLILTEEQRDTLTRIYNDGKDDFSCVELEGGVIEPTGKYFAAQVEQTENPGLVEIQSALMELPQQELTEDDFLIKPINRN